MLIVDRFEGDYAIIENEDEYYDVKKDRLPKDCREGDILILKNNVYTIDKKQTKLHKEFIRELQRSSFKDIDNF